VLSHLREVHALYLLELPILGVAGAYEPMQMQEQTMNSISLSLGNLSVSVALILPP
jgi:hypothetical protein